MISLRVFSTVICVLGILASPRASAVEPIKVLLARGSTAVSESVVRAALDQANDVVTDTGLPSHVLQSAEMDGATPTVFYVNCPGTSTTTGPEQVQCAIDNLADLRDDHLADVVLMVVDDMNTCGSVFPDMINSATISEANEHLAYATVKLACLTSPTRKMKEQRMR